MIKVGLSTISVFPKGVEEGFRLSAEAGYDGVEVMVTTDAKTRSAERLLELSAQYGQPIMAIHAPVVLLTTFVWGRDPFVKLDRSAELAVAVGAPAVVVHPPFRWQGKYARTFEDAVRQTERKHGVEVAVENMFPWAAGGIDRQAYLPGIDPSEMDVEHATLDFSHCALAKRDSMELALDLGDRLRHVHLTDGVAAEGGRIFDEHLLPGRGNEPVAEVLRMLAERRWTGQVVAEIKTRYARNERERLAMLTETLEFAREHLAVDSAAEPAGEPGPAPEHR
ncbi:sugar phosphate isomerase/epimerase [Agrococcus sp. Marseille-Q4369]|uniref:sugar phosphate isomerase/epimerase family protein n=1 Tax=Agrococcus sp. Marseille-Q4369 TaxID=2810513 RepID=UPI001B8DA230|nr:sugar phosphate isomerase/epimerase [Agrococcus sp. Marseille-Q4369]QUW18670.1 sugar phosphate isomerase/epimerase [Agrococcus sp. Marseille-Q4369]